MIQRLLREPLLHFAALGALLFALLADNGAEKDALSREIVVTQGQIESLSRLWQRTWQRPPTAAELEGIIRNHVREEILYREARAMGLDENDSVIRRRLRQKLEFLAEDFAAMTEPTRNQLQTYLDNNLERYAIAPRLSFRHIFISEDRHGEALDDFVASLRSMLPEQLSVEDASEDLGDPLPLPRRFEDVTPGEVSRTFGDTFADALPNLPTASWQGPVSSAFGQHLVYVLRHEPGRAPALEEVRQAVRRDWLAEQQRQTREAFYTSLREQYEVTIEGVPEGLSGGSASTREPH